MKVITKDFQILEGVHEFEFKPGINMVIGPNASGKSSLFYAIENCLLNPSGVSDCINYNHDKASVNIQSNNESVVWERTPDSSTYINNKTGKKFIKASKLDSRDIADLGFYFDKKNNVVNIHDEWSVLFPFGESDTDMFRLFEDIFNISCSFKVLDEMKKEEQNVKGIITQIQNQKQETEDKKRKLNEIKEKVKLSDVQDRLNSIETKLAQTSKLREDYEQYTKSALLQNVALPKIFDVSKLYENSHKYENLVQDFKLYESLKEKLNINIPKMEFVLKDDTELKNLKESYSEYNSLKVKLQEMEVELELIIGRKQHLEAELSKIKVCPTCGRPLE